MNDSLQTINAPDDAWMIQEYGEDQICLTGNRHAFEALRSSIDQILSGKTTTLWIENEETQIASLKLQDVQDQVPPTSFKEKIFIYSIVVLFVFILFLGLCTLIAGVASLFS